MQNFEQWTEALAKGITSSCDDEDINIPIQFRQLSDEEFDDDDQLD